MYQEEFEKQYNDDKYPQYNDEYLLQMDKNEFQLADTNLKNNRNISQFTKEIVTPIFKSGKEYEFWVYDNNMIDVIKSFASNLKKEICRWEKSKPEKTYWKFITGYDIFRGYVKNNQENCDNLVNIVKGKYNQFSNYDIVILRKYFTHYRIPSHKIICRLSNIQDYYIEKLVGSIKEKVCRSSHDFSSYEWDKINRETIDHILMLYPNLRFCNTDKYTISWEPISDHNMEINRWVNKKSVCNII